MRRFLYHLDRFAEATNEILLVIAVGLGGFYFSVLVILALMSSPPADDPGGFGRPAIDRASGIVSRDGF